MSAKDKTEYDATGMLKHVSLVCVRAFAFSAHFGCFLAILCVGITLFVSTQGCGKPQMTDEQIVDTRVFSLCNQSENE